MKRVFPVTTFILAALFVGCQKQQTEDERRAEVEREVEQRLATERQQQQAQQLNQREAELNAREQSLRQNEQTSVAAQPGDTTVAAERATGEEISADGGQPAGSYSIFYNKLEPYGDWIETRNYGYVYRPREAGDSRWRPYVNGRWAYTDAGWTWISEEPFGWATYHYGRWTRIRGVGWVWVPGQEWAPAWVSWRKGNEYIGWAPLPPEARFDRRRGIHNWSDNYYNIGPGQYVFVQAQQFGQERVERAIVPEQRNLTIVDETTNVTNITYNNSVVVNQGPNYDELKRQSQNPIPRLRIERQLNAPGNEARAAIRGDVVEIPAPLVASARPAERERPRIVKQTIAQTAVDLGWSSDPRETEKARTKMKSEATPPPDAPPKKLVDTSETASSPSAMNTNPPTNTSPPVANTAGTPTAAKQPSFVRHTPSPIAAPTSASTITPTIAPHVAPAGSPAETERSAASASQAPSTSITPAPQAGPDRPELSPNSQPSVAPTSGQLPSPASSPEPRKKFKSVARQFEKPVTVPMPPAPGSSRTFSSPGENSASGPQPEELRRSRSSRQPRVAPTASSPSATNSSTRPTDAESGPVTSAQPSPSAKASPSSPTPSP